MNSMLELIQEVFGWVRSELKCLVARHKEGEKRKKFSRGHTLCSYSILLASDYFLISDHIKQQRSWAGWLSRTASRRRSKWVKKNKKIFCIRAPKHNSTVCLFWKTYTTIGFLSLICGPRSNKVHLLCCLLVLQRMKGSSIEATGSETASKHLTSFSWDLVCTYIIIKVHHPSVAVELCPWE